MMLAIFHMWYLERLYTTSIEAGSFLPTGPLQSFSWQKRAASITIVIFKFVHLVMLSCPALSLMPSTLWLVHVLLPINDGVEAEVDGHLDQPTSKEAIMFDYSVIPNGADVRIEL
jgi:hypothetical protein